MGQFPWGAVAAICGFGIAMGSFFLWTVKAVIREQFDLHRVEMRDTYATKERVDGLEQRLFGPAMVPVKWGSRGHGD